MPHKSCVASDSEIRGVPGMLNSMFEMDLNPPTDPTTAPKPTSAQVLMTGRAQLSPAGQRLQLLGMM
ncbi:hypothetical protein QTI17_30850 [Variovorax sp. J31P179]|uniref:hypothetical protein n=1 Tax=Variovorax sp. J31P179 TaxID=3053508 RepID=UPI002576B4BD|nr:hypothetical protein [Variovorax sp. J31P179]MDM0084998.1 hypothetical protein [Variovorax sp. J31P179]